ncbi:hypothetical protein JOM56_012112 [Amanita muscaria]
MDDSNATEQIRTISGHHQESYTLCQRVPLRFIISSVPDAHMAKFIAAEEIRKREEELNDRMEEIEKEEEETERRKEATLHLAEQTRRKAGELKRRKEELMKREEDLERRKAQREPGRQRQSLLFPILLFLCTLTLLVSFLVLAVEGYPRL